MSVKFEEPPARVAQRGRWLPVIAELKANPGRWALIAENVATGGISAMRKTYPGVEVRTVGNRNNRAAKVYARWMDGEA